MYYDESSDDSSISMSTIDDFYPEVTLSSNFKEIAVNQPQDYFLYVPGISFNALADFIRHSSNNGFKAKLYPKEQITVKLSESEKLEKKREYRREYRTRPDVIKKKEEEKNDPDLIKKRKEYASRPEVKERKKQMAAVRRAYINQMRECPNIGYKEFVKKNVPKIQRKRKDSQLINNDADNRKIDVIETENTRT